MIIEYPLTKPHRLQLARAFRSVPRIDLSVECVVEGQMGQAFVDDTDTPCVYQIQTGLFVYFAGDPLSAGGQEMLKRLKPWTIVMPSAEGWLEAGESMYGDRLHSFERYSFSSQGLSLETLEKLSLASAFGGAVKRMDLSLAEQVWGQEHFVDLSDFESAADFVARGIGFYVEQRSEIIGAAYSSLVCSRGIEVSIFVADDYRRAGMATVLAASLLRWCLQNGMEPHWDAANIPSCRLAEKLGYAPQGSYRAHYLRPLL